MPLFKLCIATFRHRLIKEKDREIYLFCFKYPVGNTNFNGWHTPCVFKGYHELRTKCFRRKQIMYFHCGLEILYYIRNVCRRYGWFQTTTAAKKITSYRVWQIRFHVLSVICFTHQIVDLNCFEIRTWMNNNLAFTRVWLLIHAIVSMPIYVILVNGHQAHTIKKPLI